MADLLTHLGGVAPERVRMTPAPGTATEKDVTWSDDHEDRLYELVDGVLVEKIYGLRKSYLGVEIGARLAIRVKAKDLGFVLGASGAYKLAAGLVRTPDVSFVSWGRLPSRTIPAEPIPELAPDLAVEILSPGHTPGEMARKLRDYFAHGVTLVWLVDPANRSADVYTAPEQCVRIPEAGTLTGEPVVPGFRLPLRDLFARLA